MAQFETILALISAAGAFGIAAYGVVEALGKALAWRGAIWDGWFSVSDRWRQPFGLPFVGFGTVKTLALLVGPALQRTYGDDYLDILLQQYREGRGKGAAPATLRQGVLLALPFMPKAEVAAIITDVWGLDSPARSQEPNSYARRLAAALVDEKTGERTEGSPQDEALAGRFSVALDARIQAAFAVAEERYGAVLRVWAAVAAIGLAVAFNEITGDGILRMLDITRDSPGPYLFGKDITGPLTAALFGAVAVPLAPVANDLVSALSQAMKAWRSASVVKRAG
jgi:hypothetical protein